MPEKNYYTGHNAVLRPLKLYYIYATIKCALEDDMDRACSRHGEKRNAYIVFVEKREEKRPLGRFRRSCEDNIKMDLIEMG